LPGGTAGQALTKVDATDGNVQWAGPHLLLTGGTVTGDVNLTGSTTDLTVEANITTTGGAVFARGYYVEGRRLICINGGGFGNPAEQIRFGYNGQAGGTYRHEIRTEHHGGEIYGNAIELWLHGSSKWNPAQASGDAAINRVAKFAGTAINLDQPVVQVRSADFQSINNAGYRVVKTNQADNTVTMVSAYDGGNFNNDHFLGQIAVNRHGFYAYGPFTNLIFYCNNGGWGINTPLTLQTGAAQTVVYAQHNMSAVAYTTRSDLRPVRYQRLAKPPIDGERKAAPDVDEIGLIAQDVQAADPSLVSESLPTEDDPEGGLLGYSVTGVLALAIAEIKRLGAKVAQLEARLAAT
jgi:hypothetical protein